MGFKEQSPQNVTQSLIGEIPFIECLHHPVVEEVQFWIEKLVIRLERCTQQAAFRFESALNGCPRVRQHPAERRDRPAIAYELFQKPDVLPDTATRRIRINQHESEVEGESEPLEDSSGSQMRLRLQAFAHVNESFFISRFNPHVDVRSPPAINRSRTSS